MGQAHTPACPISFMLTKLQAAIIVPIVLALLPAATFSQAPRKSKLSAPSSTSATHGGLDLAEKGHCREALPILKKSASLTADKQTKLKMGLAITRCALSLGQVETTVNALLWLNLAQARRKLGDFVLANDLKCAGDAFVIKVDNVVLDLNGHTLNGPGMGPQTWPNPQLDSVGVRVGGHTNVTVRNGTIDGFSTGVYFVDMVRSSIEGIYSQHNRYGFYIQASTGIAIRRSTAFANIYGLHLQESSNNVVQTVPFGNGIFATAAFWNNNLYLAGSGTLKALTFNPATSQFNTTPSSQSTDTYGFPGASPSVSSSGATNGIVWAMSSNAYGTNNNGPRAAGPALRTLRVRPAERALGRARQRPERQSAAPLGCWSTTTAAPRAGPRRARPAARTANRPRRLSCKSVDLRPADRLRGP